MKFNLPELKYGMKVKCFKCGEAILLSEETMKMDALEEYIECPSCKFGYDTHKYHKDGEEIK